MKLRSSYALTLMTLSLFSLSQASGEIDAKAGAEDNAFETFTPQSSAQAALMQMVGKSVQESAESLKGIGNIVGEEVEEQAIHYFLSRRALRKELKSRGATASEISAAMQENASQHLLEVIALMAQLSKPLVDRTPIILGELVRMAVIAIDTPPTYLASVHEGVKQAAANLHEAQESEDGGDGQEGQEQDGEAILAAIFSSAVSTATTDLP